MKHQHDAAERCAQCHAPLTIVEGTYLYRGAELRQAYPTCKPCNAQWGAERGQCANA